VTIGEGWGGGREERMLEVLLNYNATPCDNFNFSKFDDKVRAAINGSIVNDLRKKELLLIPDPIPP